MIFQDLIDILAGDCAGIDSVLSVKPLTVKRSNNRGLLTGSITRINSAADFDGSVIVSGASGNYIAEAFGYDSRERVAENVSVDPQGVAVRENSTYSSSGLPLTTNTVRRAPDGDIEELGFVYAYDDFDRQTSVTTSVNGVEMAVSATSYDAVGRTAAVTMRDMRSETGQTVGYSYITNGAVKSIATSSGSMAMTLHYASGAAPSYSGNISGMEWKGADKVQRSYTYSYDGLNRLVAAQYAESGRPTYSHLLQQGSPDYSCTYSYDLNGNPLSVVRKGLTEVMGSGSSHLLARFGTVDNLTLKYSGNQVTKVSDSASNTSYTGASDFGDNNYREVEYEYDANGNMTLDFNRKIMGVVYNRINQPVRVEIGSGSFVENLYDADGSLRQRRLRQKAEGIPTIGGFFPADSIDSEGNYIRVTDYCGPWEYVNGKPSRTRIPGGYIEGDSVYFNITDLQGNIRQIWNATTAKTVQDNHYYPYGALLGESASTEYVKAVARGNRHPVSTNPYKYSAKEWQPAFGLNLYDFIARQYDPALCRFTSPDPLNFNYPHLSPYLYCAANPINYSDPSGLNPIFDWDGNYLGESKEGYTGEVLIYDGKEYIDFSRYSASELTQLGLVKRLGEVSAQLSINAMLSIINHVVGHFNGTVIFGETFDTSRMKGGKIQHLKHDNKAILWATAFKYEDGEIIDPPKIYWVNDFTSVYDATVENIISTALVHEWYSHGIMHIERDEIYHKQAYLNVCNSPFWNNTSKKYKKFVLNNLLTMLSFGQNNSIFYNNLVDNLFELITKMYAK
ncbi:MAG: RHS repeat-associated core domain-containing protein [Muribaculaceae bacterium]|nr:RHS repeat-associated core domain-containing protein [Muribaculaceae bacterium]